MPAKNSAMRARSNILQLHSQIQIILSTEPDTKTGCRKDIDRLVTKWPCASPMVRTQRSSYDIQITGIKNHVGELSQNHFTKTLMS